MSADPRCAGHVLVQKDGYRIVQCVKAHYLDAIQFAIEKKTYVDALGVQNWAPLSSSDLEVALGWLVNQLGDHIVQNLESTSPKRVVDIGDASEGQIRSTDEPNKS